MKKQEHQAEWNKVEHRLFLFIAQNGRGKPLYSLATIIKLIAKTTMRPGLEIRCMLDHRVYLKAIKIADEQMAEVNLAPHSYHGDWNYTIDPADGIPHIIYSSRRNLAGTASAFLALSRKSLEGNEI
ncbi:MAG: hypothetical protein HYU36_18340 [Planctomycetes bacterium]|nr:hypothetical protein [Planctomycetota bacterium]